MVILFDFSICTWCKIHFKAIELEVNDFCGKLSLLVQNAPESKTSNVLVTSAFGHVTPSYGNRTEWSLPPIRSLFILLITKSDNRAAGVIFVYHEYDYRSNWTTRSLVTN